MRNLSVAILFTFLGVFALGQKATNSPYSSFGLGELGGLDHAVLAGIGNSNVTMIDSTFINYYNPASYASLAKGQPLFTVGVSSRLSNYSENGLTNFNSVTSVQHFALAFPFANRFGLAFGLKPYSRRGYEFSTRTAVNDDSLYYNYSGTGGVNEAFLGFAANILNTNKTRLALGGNLGYLFGNVTNTRKSALLENGVALTGGVSVESLRASAVHYEVGLNFSHRLNDKHTIGASFVIDPMQKIGGDYEYGLYFANDINNPNGYDTANFNDSLTGGISNIPSYTYGINYKLSFTGNKETTRELNSELGFHLSYTTSEWSKYENRYNTSYTNEFLDSYKLAFGIQYVPETQFLANKVTTKFYHRMRYRIGTYYQTLPYQTNGEQVTDFGTTFGLGIPIVVQNSISSINLGFSYGNRGTSDSQSLKEQYYGINVGISISPGADKWFVKRKLN